MRKIPYDSAVSMDELAASYQQTSTVLRGRIVELEHQSKAEADPVRKQLLLSRTRPLRSMYKDTRELARYLANYYPRRAIP